MKPLVQLRKYLFLFVLFFLSSGCGKMFGKVSGKVHFDASFLPPTAYMTIRLQDTSYADASAEKNS